MNGRPSSSICLLMTCVSLVVYKWSGSSDSRNSFVPLAANTLHEGGDDAVTLGVSVPPHAAGTKQNVPGAVWPSQQVVGLHSELPCPRPGTFFREIFRSPSGMDQMVFQTWFADTSLTLAEVQEARVRVPQSKLRRRMGWSSPAYATDTGTSGENKNKTRHPFCDGVVVDVGAHEGVKGSNSLFFESLGWRSICVEANPVKFAQLVQHRPYCVNRQVAAAQRKGVAPFVRADWSGGLASTLDVETVAENYRYTAEDIAARTHNVSTEPLSLILESEGISHIDFLSIDVEGAELQVLRGLDLNRVTVTALVVEANPTQRRKNADVRELLETQGFRRVAHVHTDELYFRDPPSWLVVPPDSRWRGTLAMCSCTSEDARRVREEIGSGDVVVQSVQDVRHAARRAFRGLCSLSRTPTRDTLTVPPFRWLDIGALAEVPTSFNSSRAWRCLCVDRMWSPAKRTRPECVAVEVDQVSAMTEEELRVWAHTYDFSPTHVAFIALPLNSRNGIEELRKLAQVVHRVTQPLVLSLGLTSEAPLNHRDMAGLVHDLPYRLLGTRVVNVTSSPLSSSVWGIYVATPFAD